MPAAPLRPRRDDDEPPGAARARVAAAPPSVPPVREAPIDRPVPQVLLVLALGAVLAVVLVTFGAMVEGTRVPAPGAIATTGAPPAGVGRSLDQKVHAARSLEKASLVLGFVGLAGTVFVLGVLAFVLLIVPVPAQEAPPLPRGDPLTRVVVVAVVATVAASTATLLVRVGIESDRGWSGVADGRALGVVVPGAVGASVLFRVAGAVLALVVLTAPARGWRQPVSVVRGGVSIIGGLAVDAATRRRAAGAAAAGVALVSFVTVGHAQATEPRVLLMAADLAHVVAASVWFGGIAVLALTLRRARRGGVLPFIGPLDDGESPRRCLARTVGRFGRAAAVSVVAVTLAGTALAVSQLRTVEALVSTAYGVTLLAKLACVGVVVALGAYNHRVVVARVLRDEHDLRAWTALQRIVAVEATVVLAGVLLASVALAGGGFGRWVG